MVPELDIHAEELVEAPIHKLATQRSSKDGQGLFGDEPVDRKTVVEGSTFNSVGD